MKDRLGDQLSPSDELSFVLVIGLARPLKSYANDQSGHTARMPVKFMDLASRVYNVVLRASKETIRSLGRFSDL